MSTMSETKRPRRGLHARTEPMPAIEDFNDFKERMSHPGRAVLLPSQDDMFRMRLRALWDWFRLSVVLFGYVTILVSGGILVTRGLIFLWGSVLGEYFEG